MVVKVIVMEMDKTENIGSINKMLDEINSDRTVPKNIRFLVSEAKLNLNNDENDIDLRINSAISLLDDISNDPNIPIYTRTQVWNIVSLLEVMQRGNN